MKLKSSVVIVTGGGTGIGKATALLFAERGVRVVVCGRRLAPLMENGTVTYTEERRRFGLTNGCLWTGCK